MSIRPQKEVPAPKKKRNKNKIKKYVLNIGWGGIPLNYKAPDEVEIIVHNQDMFSIITPEGHNKTDIVCDARKLDIIDDNTYDTVTGIHVLEHFHFFEAPSLLKEWLRVLKPGGLLHLEVPNLAWVIRNFEGDLEKPLYYGKNTVNNETIDLPVTGLDMIYGFQKDVQEGRQGMEHKMIYDCTTLYNLLNKQGLVKIEVRPNPTMEGTIIADALKPYSPEEATLVNKFMRKEESD